MSEALEQMAEALDQAKGEAAQWLRLYQERGEALAEANDRADRLQAELVALRRRLVLLESKPAAWEESLLVAGHDLAMAAVRARQRERAAELARLDAEETATSPGAAEAAFRAAFRRQTQASKVEDGE